MFTWILVSLTGVFLSARGLIAVGRRYHRGEVGRLYVGAVFAGFASFIAFVVLDSLVPGSMNGLVGVLVLLPAFASLFVLIRDHQKSGVARR